MNEVNIGHNDELIERQTLEAINAMLADAVQKPGPGFRKRRTKFGMPLGYEDDPWVTFLKPSEWPQNGSLAKRFGRENAMSLVRRERIDYLEGMIWGMEVILSEYVPAELQGRRPVPVEAPSYLLEVRGSDSEGRSSSPYETFVLNAEGEVVIHDLPGWLVEYIDGSPYTDTYEDRITITYYEPSSERRVFDYLTGISADRYEFPE